MNVVVDKPSSIARLTMSEARKDLAGVLDAAEAGRIPVVQRRGKKAAVVELGRLRYMLSQIIVPRGAQVVHEGGLWVAYLEGLPLAAEEPSFDGAIDELIRAMREYAADWEDHLHAAPNHKDNWGLVQFTVLSTDEQLKEWLLAFDE
ncbi:prevent-host-death protein [Rhodococcus aetherivorans]|uniref:prevent-host-death protein n=1 Tax=Rhodococcus aetherivorans TaxID=191292 RepID=UPI00369A6889